MKLQQLRYLVEVARQGLSVSEAAESLFTSQPGVSKQIRLLEDELGVVVFERSGKRLTGITEPGRAILEIAGRILREADNLRRVGEEYASGDTGELHIATTHTQARYALPQVVKLFVERHPGVRLVLHQGSPTQAAEWAERGDADLAIATEALAQHPTLLTLPCHQWGHCVIVPRGHPLCDASQLNLAALSSWPLITYDPAFAGRTRIDQAFARAGLAPNIVLTAIDSDVIKTYVTLGLGVGIIAGMAYDAGRDSELAAFPVEHLFGSNTTRIGVRRGAYLRRYEYDFIELFAPQFTRHAVELAMAGGGDEYQL